ncbi:DUF2798 domain-containing protein [Sinorhizobium sp. BG8]|uniref:DUF2798 domain-containing protein n=1 Tax=Sinorhizobium sp. BG8 TaxID=2613773 RepID=UPI00193E9BB9|nr:DUF2798 domain-containing protein [Sinorhizobium sp. BG8]QRM54930.1 DUF2798 domain-containing protein [Sinorhizobium sp. BG8]
MNDTKTIILAQFFISGMMAFLMTGFFSLLHVGFTTDCLTEWSRAFAIAWPVAFILSLGVGKCGFALAVSIRARFA